jgi:hypothetical protein
MRYIVLIMLVLFLLSSCFEKTCGEQGGEIKAMAPIMYMEGDKLKTVYPTECVKP